MAHLFATPGIWESLTTLTIIEDNFNMYYQVSQTEGNFERCQVEKMKKIIKKMD